MGGAVGNKDVLDELSAIKGTGWLSAADALANVSDLKTNTDYISSTAITAPANASIGDIIQEISMTAISSPAANSLFARTQIVMSQTSGGLEYLSATTYGLSALLSGISATYTRAGSILSQTSSALEYLSATTYGLSALLSGISATYNKTISAISVISASVDSLTADIEQLSAALGYLFSTTVGDTPVTGSVSDMLRDGLMQSGGTILPSTKSLYDVLYKEKYYNASATVSALTSTTLITQLLELSMVSTSFRKRIHNIYLDMNDFNTKALTANITVDIKLQAKIDGTNWRTIDNKIHVNTDNAGEVIGPFVIAEDARIYLSASTGALSAGTGITALSVPTRYVYEYLEPA